SIRLNVFVIDGTLSRMDGHIDISTLTFDGATLIATGTYESSRVNLGCINGGAPKTTVLSAGSYNFAKDLQIYSDGTNCSAFTLNNAVNNPNFTIGGNLSLSETHGG